ncbi:MAG TPA: PAS domain S-box protein, partial [Rhodothermales bacterium]
MRIVHLEDCELDSELIRAHLQSEGIEAEFLRVETEAEFVDALREPVDLILSDYSLPGWDAMEALHWVRQQRPDVPFLFVTGALGEERAIETLKAGATDYVLKDRLGRLGPSVRRALREARERRDRKSIEESLRESEERFRLMAQTVPSILFTTDPTGACDYVNERFTEFTGLPLEAALGSDWLQTVHPDDLMTLRARWKHSLSAGVPFECEYRLRGKDGVYRWFVSRSRPIRNAQGQIAKWFGAATDIEDQKRVEAALRDSESRLRRLVESNIIGVILANEEGLIYESNTAFLETIGYTRDDLLAG